MLHCSKRWRKLKMAGINPTSWDDGWLLPKYAAAITGRT